MKVVYAFLMLSFLLSVPTLPAQIAVRDYNFSTPGDAEGWTAIKYEAGALGQAVASSGEGALQVRMLSSGSPGDVDMQLFANPGTAALPIGSTWESVKFRVRQLHDDGTGAPGTPQIFNLAGTIMLFTLGGSGRNVGGFNAPHWSATTQDADGWIEYSFDLAQYIANNSLTHTNITSVRLDVIGDQVNYGKWAQVDYFRLLATVPRSTEPAFVEYSFESAGVAEGWTAVNPETGSFGQVSASSGEGVLQVRQMTNGTEDVQLYANPGTLSISADRNWDSFEFRLRQLKDSGSGSPGTPRSFHAPGTILLISGYAGSARNFGAVGGSGYWWKHPADSDGWTVFTFDLAQYLSDNGLSSNAAFTQVRLDPSGSAQTVGDWIQIDYFRINATPQPPPTGTILLVL